MKAARETKVSEPCTDTCKHVRLVQWSTQLGSIHTVDTVFAEQGEFMGTRSSCSPVVWTQAASYNAEGDKLKLTPVESGICETGRRRTAKHAEFRCHKTPGHPCQPSPPNIPPPSRRCEKERGRSERKKGWSVRGRNLVSGSKREERNVKKTRIGRKEVKVTSTEVRYQERQKLN